MWKYNKYVAVFFILFFLPRLASGQNCDIVISGVVSDIRSGSPISSVNVYLQEAQIGGSTDSLGYFRIEPVCAGPHHISFSHVSCETEDLYLTVQGDTTLTISLSYDSQFLDEAAVITEGGKKSSQKSQSINSDNISENSDKNLATMLERISGVSVIKNGSGISKPVVHGLYGSRLSILNNGITQSGQQWGADHSPEIDPLVANKITVIKGVGALEYQGNSLGSVVLVEPEKIIDQPGLHGKGRYHFQTNGLGHGLNLELQQHTELLAWKVVGTLKKSGDHRTSEYFLRNTGNEEANAALQLEKSWSKKWFSELYVSSFNAEIGVLRGAHIGNLTDLESALEREVPFFTEDDFSYAMDAPYQKVNHHLLKFHTKYSINEKQWIDVTYARQYNLRKEFDVRRSGRTDIPALSLEQTSSFMEVKYQNYLPKNWHLKSGVQTQRVINTNLPETGILPLIPNYLSDEYGLFSTMTKRIKKTTLELGGRFDFENRKVVAISTSVPREIIRDERDYSNISAVGGVIHELRKGWNVAYNIGYAARNPEVNELFSNGLHQGVSGIEEGDIHLKKETSIKSTVSFRGKVGDKLILDGLFYYQGIDDYIFLNPQDEIRLTIRGAFPVFKYEQTNAQLLGFDGTIKYEATERLELTAQYSYLHGSDLTNDLPLVNMPSNNLYSEVNYHLPKVGKLQNVKLQVNSRVVFEQRNLLASQDFVIPPPMYHLVGFKLSAERDWSKCKLNIFIRAENLFNESYRDYLNRQRYFADGLGVNLISGVTFSF